MSDSEEERVQIGLVVEYCTVCSAPFEYCKYLKPKCTRPKDVEGATESMEKLKVEEKKEEPKMKMSSKTRKKAKVELPCILIEKSERARKKTATIIYGLEQMGLKPKKATGAFKKRFACGVSVGKPNPTVFNLGECVVQGDVAYEIVPFLMEKFSIPGERIHYRKKNNATFPAVIRGMVQPPPQ